MDNENLESEKPKNFIERFLDKFEDAPLIFPISPYQELNNSDEN